MRLFPKESVRQNWQCIDRARDVRQDGFIDDTLRGETDGASPRRRTIGPSY